MKMIRARLRTVLPAALAVVVSAAAAGTARAELTLPRVSQNATVTQTVGLTDFRVVYHRPGVKGRKIWGGLVPYGEKWRLGANDATSFAVTGDATVGGQKVPAGEYSIYAVPTEKEWTLVITKEKGLWNELTFAADQEVARFTAAPTKGPHEEWMRFSFENLSSDGADLVLRWETLRVDIPLRVDTNAQAMASIRAAMAELKSDDWQTPYRAAQYCFNAGVHMDEAMAWAEKSVATKEMYFNLSLLADMKMKAGNQKEAIAVAEKAVKVGKADPNKPDTSPTESKISEWKGKKG
jgi:hypothetical protein